MFPSGDFLKRVIHTHIHDISRDGATHFPLTSGILPLSECLDRLANEKYQGYLNFEPSIDRWPGNPDEKRSATLESIKILSAALGE
jgi:sugar phosphate isomerase/epimerase